MNLTDIVTSPELIETTKIAAVWTAFCGCLLGKAALALIFGSAPIVILKVALAIATRERRAVVVNLVSLDENLTHRV